MRCAFCGRRVDPKSTWKGAVDQFYCSEFCADSESPEDSGDPPTAAALLDLHRKRSYERLERLLPCMRAYSGRPISSPR
jgi:hypothetical protein